MNSTRQRRNNPDGGLESEYELRLNTEGRGRDRHANRPPLSEFVAEFSHDSRPEDRAPAQRQEAANPKVVDHSANISNDFGHFLFEENLSDLCLIVRKGKDPFDARTEPASAETARLPCHKFVLSARCQYFYTQFCRGEWSDKNQSEASFTQFSEAPMREFLKYLYTGKLDLTIDKIMGILRISSYFGMEKLSDTCKAQLTDPAILSASDLCKLFCEVREQGQDFDDMRAFLTEIIPKRVDNSMIPCLLREIWRSDCDGLQTILL